MTRDREPYSAGILTALLACTAVICSIRMYAQETGKIQDNKLQIEAAEKQINAGNIKSAEQILRNVLAKEPGNQRAVSLLGKILFDQQRFSEAYDVYAVVKKSGRGSEDTDLWLGACALNLERYEEALSLLKPLVKSGDAEIAPLASLYAATALISLGRNTEASPLLEKLMQGAGVIAETAAKLHNNTAANQPAASPKTGWSAAYSFGHDTAISGIGDIDVPTGKASSFIEAAGVFAAIPQIAGTNITILCHVSGRYYASVEDYSFIAAGVEAEAMFRKIPVAVSGTWSHEKSGTSRAAATIGISSDTHTEDRPPAWEFRLFTAMYEPDAISGADGWGASFNVSPKAEDADGIVTFSTDWNVADDETLTRGGIGAGFRLPLGGSVFLDVSGTARIYPDGIAGGGMRKDMLGGAGLSITVRNDDSVNIELGVRGERNLSNLDSAEYDRVNSWFSVTLIF